MTKTSVRHDGSGTLALTVCLSTMAAPFDIPLTDETEPMDFGRRASPDHLYRDQALPDGKLALRRFVLLTCLALGLGAAL